MKIINTEWNEYVIGYVLTTDDDRSINVQYEKNRNTNHPEPDIIAVIGAEGDETIDNFNEDEQEEIKVFISKNDEIQRIADAMTTIVYSDNYDKDIWTDFYGAMTASDILELADSLSDE